MRVFLVIAVATSVTITSLVLAAEPVKVNVVFSGLWWTQEQIEKWGEQQSEDIRTTGRQQDRPLPPKETRTIIKEWVDEFDMMPPAPEVVDVDITVASNDAVKEIAEVSYQYEEKNHLTAPAMLVRGVVDLAPGASQVLHGSINLGEYLRKHSPKSIRVTTRVGKRHPVTAKLPIAVGD